MASPFDHPGLSRRYFFPRAGAPVDRLEVEVPGATLACAYQVRDPTWPTMIYFHGNGEVVSDYQPAAESLFATLGVNTLFAEYRGYGASSGTPQLAAMLGDVEAIAAAAGQPPERIIAFGRSIGSIYAIELARRLPVAGLVLESGIADVLERVLMRARPEELGSSLEGMRAAARRDFDHEAKLAAYRGRLLVLHAARDHLVPTHHAERNHEWCGAPDKELVIFPRGDHNSIFADNAAAYLRALGDFIQRAAPRAP